MRTAVVVATWTDADPADLAHLLAGMARHPAGAEHDLVLCVNGDVELAADVADAFVEVFRRENTGYNLGAWQHAWQRLPDHDRFLFLQDDCSVRRDGWLAAHAACHDAADDVGLVGEHWHRSWDRPWEELCARDDRKGERARQYRARIEAWGIDPGARAGHLTTVVQYTARAVLERTGGYREGATWPEAVAAEIAFSKAVEAVGLRVLQVARHRHHYLAHPQWPSPDVVSRLVRSVRKRLGREPGRKRGGGERGSADA